ncbi:MAG: hypothetical protein KY455_09515 [Euryarchaeota archaeon]|nr:hypothetical protein [Euryarchaeota archaeon]
MLEAFDPLRFLAGTALYLLPGVVWTWALAPRLAWFQKVPLSVVVAFTVQPGVLFLLHLLFSVPLDLATNVFLAVALALLGTAVLVRRWTSRHLVAA